MLKISDAVRDLVAANPWLQFGLHHRLLNLSQTARFLRPLVEARTHKEAKPSAILMSLSRHQQDVERPAVDDVVQFYVDRINIHHGLCSLTVPKSQRTHQEISQLMHRIQEENGYLTLTEGHTEITVILEGQHWAHVQAVLTVPPKQVQRRMAGLGVTFKEQYLEVPGLLYQLLQQLALQQINVIEIASTMTEFNIYLHEADLMPAFDAVYQKFSREGPHPRV